MDSSDDFKGSYDAVSDVLYLQHPGGVAVRGVEDDVGLVWRYGVDGLLLGLTVVDFQGLWSEHASLIASRISKNFDVTADTANEVVARIVGKK